MHECSALHESTEDYGAKRSEQRMGMGMRNDVATAAARKFSIAWSGRGSRQGAKDAKTRAKERVCKRRERAENALSHGCVHVK